MLYKPIFLACKISKGSFSEECIFEFMFESGFYKGICPRSHCFKEDYSCLGKNEPDEDLKMDGYIDVYKLPDSNNKFYVVLPDGEVICVNEDLLII